jgi:hypothetical protein
MNKKMQTSRGLEGEGSYSATRAYNGKLRAFTADADVAALADSARRALAGPEAAELRRAEAQGKRPPAKRGKGRR